jgi:hypothetical protein
MRWSQQIGGVSGSSKRLRRQQERHAFSLELHASFWTIPSMLNSVLSDLIHISARCTFLLWQLCQNQHQRYWCCAASCRIRISSLSSTHHRRALRAGLIACYQFPCLISCCSSFPLITNIHCWSTNTSQQKHIEGRRPSCCCSSTAARSFSGRIPPLLRWIPPSDLMRI